MSVKSICQKIIHTMELLEPAARSPHGLSGRGGDKLPFSEKLLECKADLKATLASWALMVAEESNPPLDCADTIEGIAGWLSLNSTHLDAHPAVEDFHQEVGNILTAIYSHLNPAEWEYCGEWNGITIRVPKGQKTVTFPNGEVQLVETIKKQRRRKTLEHVGTAKEVSDILAIIHSITVTPKQIIKWYEHDKKKRSQGLLQPFDGLDNSGMNGRKPLFKVDDVVSRITCAQHVQEGKLKTR